MIKIDQIAIATNNPEKLIERYKLLGFKDWVHDRVEAEGLCYGMKTKPIADLYFNYDTGIEIEILKYVENGEENWHSPVIQRQFKTVQDYVFTSHMGMHVKNKEELFGIVNSIKDNIPGTKIIQEVITISHTNPVIKDTRRYHYVILGTRGSLGYDIKLIMRLEA